MLQENLIDMVAMDIKAPPAKYKSYRDMLALMFSIST